MKARLEIDMPESCVHCKLSTPYYDGKGTRFYCNVAATDGSYIDNPQHRPNWCPLEPILTIEERKQLAYKLNLFRRRDESKTGV